MREAGGNSPPFGALWGTIAYNQLLHLFLPFSPVLRVSAPIRVTGRRQSSGGSVKEDGSAGVWTETSNDYRLPSSWRSEMGV